MDIRQLTAIRNLTVAYAKSFGEKPNISPRAIPPNVKPINESAAEKALGAKRMADMNKAAAEFRGRVKQQTGIDLSAPRKIERVKMTEEEQAAYVQARMDRIMAGDAKYQRHLQEYEKSKVDALAKVQQNIVDISA